MQGVLVHINSKEELVMSMIKSASGVTREVKMEDWGLGCAAAPPLPTGVHGRVCAREGCSTRLSIYNYDTLCRAHTKQGGE